MKNTVAVKPSDVLTTIAGALLFAVGLVLPSYADDSSDIGLGTRQGFDVGGQVSGYHYGESFRHSFANEQYGPQFGLVGSGTQLLAFGLFATAEGRLAYGNNHYNGTGTKDDVPDYLGEIRFLGGKDFIGHQFGLSAYTGLGYRNLYNDIRGTTSDGSIGYRRDSQYLYVPVGVTPRFRVTGNSRISTNLEYDQLIRGWQNTHLEDFSSLEHDMINNQNGGYGLRGSIMYEWNSWSVGPFANYWNINQSAVKVTNTPSCNVFVGGCIEPHNQTIEAGIQAKYHF